MREALKRTESAGLSWPLPEGLNDDALEAALYGNRRSERGHRRVEEPDWAGEHCELQRKRVTLMILWDEYIAENPGGYRCSRFCEPYRAFEKTLSVTMRQTHAAAERLFVDYAGDGVPGRRPANRRDPHGAEFRRGPGRVAMQPGKLEEAAGGDRDGDSFHAENQGERPSNLRFSNHLRLRSVLATCICLSRG